jgi:hypothetical protein
MMTERSESLFRILRNKAERLVGVAVFLAACTTF